MESSSISFYIIDYHSKGCIEGQKFKAILSGSNSSETQICLPSDQAPRLFITNWRISLGFREDCFSAFAHPFLKIIYALTDQSQIVPSQPEIRPLFPQTGQDQDMTRCSFINALISPEHGLRLHRLRHLTPVASVFPLRAVTSFMIWPR